MQRPGPYKTLCITRSASHAEILKAVAYAMRKSPTRLRELAEAQRQLLDPVQRPIADFLFCLEPSFEPQAYETDDRVAIDLEWKWRDG